MLPGGASPDVPCGPDCSLHVPQRVNDGHSTAANVTQRPRLHQTPERSSTAPRSGAFTLPPLQHAFVTAEHGRVPCLWMGWETHDGHRLARVLHPVFVSDGWDLREECVPADWVEPAR